MKNSIAFTLILVVLNMVSFGQDESWKSPFAWFDKATAEEAKKILDNKGYFMYNEGCGEGWGATTISEIKKVKVIESSTGEAGYFHVEVKFETSMDDKMTRKINLDWVKVEDENGNWVHLAKLMGIEGDYCRANEE